MTMRLYDRVLAHPKTPGEVKEMLRGATVVAHYTEEKPLFGKYADQFYIPMHARGSKERGEALKDYRVLTTLEEDDVR